MKKALSTALIAVAISVTLVSDTNARFSPLKPKKGAERVEAVAPKTIVQITNNLKESEQPEEQKRIAEDLIDALLADPSLQELVRLRAAQKTIVQHMMAEKENMALGKKGWIWGGDETYTKANTEYQKLSADLKVINKKIAALEMEQPKETTSSIRYAIGTLALVLGVTALDYYLNEEAYIVKPIKKAGSWTADKAAATAGATGKTYRKYAPEILGGTPVTVR